ncbi:hypothetical protein MBAV_005990 [Candidatus Magnetobacterium bavaricum]|uniref:Uncharacterized protein n=1 Tax=Candidatus Magnetobacterium bavaricum TaxID=29290 RepID=A0A0F3GIW2_9BACT|nr:hypothetical protein MBAV_005990 [Candidatus Magnetobacterium bavaricum]
MLLIERPIITADNTIRFNTKIKITLTIFTLPLPLYILYHTLTHKSTYISAAILSENGYKLLIYKQ